MSETRKLAAILAADVVGYSRLAGADESQSAGRPPPPEPVEGAGESPGSIRMRRRITSGGGDPRESATESKPPEPGRKACQGKGGRRALLLRRLSPRPISG